VFWGIEVSPEPIKKSEVMSTLRISTIVAFGVIVMAARGAIAQDRELGSGGQLLEGVAAVVDDGLVLKSELTSRTATVIENMRRQIEQDPPEQRRQLPPVSVIEQQVLDQL